MTAIIVLVLAIGLIWVFRNQIYEKIKTSLFKRLVLDFFVLVLPWLVGAFFVILWVANYLKSIIFNNTSDIFWVVILAYLVLGFLYLEYLKVLFVADVAENTGQVLVGIITKKFYGRTSGFGWKSPLQKAQFVFDTKLDLEAISKGDAEAWGNGLLNEADNMEFSYTILYKVDNTEEGLVKYARTTPANVKASLILVGDTHVNDWIYQHTATSAKADRIDCIKPTLFTDECDEYGIVVKKASMNNLDNSKEVREFKKGETGARAFNKTKQIFKDGGMSEEEATTATKLLLNKENFKELKVSGNTSGNPIVLNP